jgi:hypothetical protein
MNITLFTKLCQKLAWEELSEVIQNLRAERIDSRSEITFSSDDCHISIFPKLFQIDYQSMTGDDDLVHSFQFSGKTGLYCHQF